MSYPQDLDAAEQVFAQGQAREQDPSLASPSGIAQREVLLTLGFIAHGEEPRTVLGGLAMTHFLDKPAVEPGEGKSISRICAAANLDQFNYDGVFTVQDVLDALVSAGFVDYDEPREDTAAALLRRDEGGYFGPTYMLKSPIKLDIERLNPELDAERQKAFEDRITYIPPRDGILTKWRKRRWVKQHTKMLKESNDNLWY